MVKGSNIFYVNGNMPNSGIDGNKIICLPCSNTGVWDKKIENTMSGSWKQPEIAYRKMKKRDLGHVDFIRVTPEIIIANMVILQGAKPNGQDDPLTVSYGAFRIALSAINNMAFRYGLTIHLPQIESGEQDEINAIIKQVVEVNTYVYTM